MNYDVLIPLLAGLATIALGGAIMLVRVLRRAPLRARLRETSAFPPPLPSTFGGAGGGAGAGGAGFGVLAAPGGGSFNDVLGEIGQRVSRGNTSSTLAEYLVQAGYHDRRAPAVFMGAKAVLLVVGAAGLGLLLLPLNVSPVLK